MSNYGINLKGISFDTLIAAYLLNPEKVKYNLTDLFLEHLNSKFEDFLITESKLDLVLQKMEDFSYELSYQRKKLEKVEKKLEKVENNLDSTIENLNNTNQFMSDIVKVNNLKIK